MNEKFCILIQIPLKFVPRGPIDNNEALVQIMACRLFGAKPLSEPMLTQFFQLLSTFIGEQQSLDAFGYVWYKKTYMVDWIEKKEYI